LIARQLGFKMDQRTPSEVLAFAPKQKPLDRADPIDQAGHALVAMLQEAAKISNENVERALDMAHKLSIQLRAAEDRIAQLQAEVQFLQNRASRAEQWLEAIKNEIQDKLIVAMEANRPEFPTVQ
jgi:chromosome segregation ATPase